VPPSDESDAVFTLVPEPLVDGLVCPEDSVLLLLLELLPQPENTANMTTIGAIVGMNLRIGTLRQFSRGPSFRFPL
jgi:hypothetical protein